MEIGLLLLRLRSNPQPAASHREGLFGKVGKGHK
jgi:hypothetical protein